MKNKFTLLFLLTLFVSPSSEAQKVTFDYVTQIGAPNTDVKSGHFVRTFDHKDRILAVDKDGFVYSSGDISAGDPEFDVLNGGTMLNYNNGRNYIAKYDSQQNLVWAKQYGNLLIRTTSLTVDTFGNIYLGGFYTNLLGPNNLSTGSVPYPVNAVGLKDMFISKLDASGNLLWAKTWGSRLDDQIHGLAVDEMGNVYATGYTSGSVDFNPGFPNAVLPGSPNGFVLKLTSSGNVLWAKGWEGNVSGNSIVLDKDENIIVTGDIRGDKKIDFNPGAGVADTFFLQNQGGSSDVFVTKLDNNGEFIWARSFGGPSQNQGFSVATDEAGAVYTTGIFCDIADFNPGGIPYVMRTQPRASNPSAIKMEVFVAKIDASGNFRWAKQINGPEENWAWSIATGKGKATGVYVTGHFEGQADFYQGNDTFTFFANPTNMDAYKNEAFLFKLDTAGNFEWSVQPGGNVSSSVIVDDNGNVFTAGYFDKNTTVDFDPDPNNTHNVNRMGNADSYILKLKWCSLSDTLKEISCSRYVFNDVTYKESGVYIISNPQGCDSAAVLVLDLTIFNLNPEITIDERTLGTAESYQTYQWMKDGEVINGATGSKYEVLENGNYQVIVADENGCTDTSAVYVVNNIVSVADMDWNDKIIVYPNPAQDLIYIDAPFATYAVLYSIEGRKIKEAGQAKSISVQDLESGIYLLHITDEKGNHIKTHKITKI